MSLLSAFREMQLRDDFESGMLAMKLGQAFRLNRRHIEEAWPMIGGDLRKALSLDRAGNRPEPVMTSEERLRQFCARNGLKLTFDRLGQHADAEHIREQCPECKGAKLIRRIVPSAEERMAPSFAGNPGEEFVTMETIDCPVCSARGWVPAKGDPNARFGDWSAVDAWLARKAAERGDHHASFGAGK